MIMLIVVVLFVVLSSLNNIIWTCFTWAFIVVRFLMGISITFFLVVMMMFIMLFVRMIMTMIVVTIIIMLMIMIVCVGMHMTLLMNMSFSMFWLGKLNWVVLRQLFSK